MKRRTFAKSLALGASFPASVAFADEPKRARAKDGDPKQMEKTPPASQAEADQRRAIRQLILTRMIEDVADEILGAKVSPKAFPARWAKDPMKFPKLTLMISDPERAFIETRERLWPQILRSMPGAPAESRDFGAMNLVVFRDAMAIPNKPDGKPDLEEIAQRVVIRAGRTGGYKGSGWMGCK